NGLPLLI
ncbi:hypothetical protein D041_4015B, partial [Vibrio parahaemolyticus EKP-008]